MPRAAASRAPAIRKPLAVCNTLARKTRILARCAALPRTASLRHVRARGAWDTTSLLWSALHQSFGARYPADRANNTKRAHSSLLRSSGGG